MQPDDQLQFQAEFPAQPPEEPKQDKVMVVIAIVGGLLILAVIAAIGAILFMGHSQRTQVETTSPESKIALTPYKNDAVDFAMQVPKDMELEYAVDDAFEGGYVVDGGSGDEKFGNRFITVRKEQYPDVYAFEYDEWQDMQVEYVEGVIDQANEDSKVRAVMAKQENLDVGQYKAYRMQTETTTQESDKKRTIRREYLSVFVSSTVYYSVEIEADAADSEFQNVTDDILKSFKV